MGFQEVKPQDKEDWIKILEAWRLILSVCDGAISRDEQGYDLFVVRGDGNG